MNSILSEYSNLTIVVDNAPGHGMAEIIEEKRRQEVEETLMKSFLATSAVFDDYESEFESSMDESELDCTWLKKGKDASTCTSGKTRNLSPVRSSSFDLRRVNTIPRCPVRRLSSDDQMIMLQNLYGRFGNEDKNDCRRGTRETLKRLGS